MHTPHTVYLTAYSSVGAVPSQSCTAIATASCSAHLSPTLKPHSRQQPLPRPPAQAQASTNLLPVSEFAASGQFKTQDILLLVKLDGI